MLTSLNSVRIKAFMTRGLRRNAIKSRGKVNIYLWQDQSHTVFCQEIFSYTVSYSASFATFNFMSSINRTQPCAVAQIVCEEPISLFSFVIPPNKQTKHR